MAAGKLAQADNQLRLEEWPLKLEGLSANWVSVLQPFWSTAVGHALSAKISANLKQGKCLYPRWPYSALAATPFEKTRGVILGQDPYHGPGQAEGLAFSVGVGQKIPPSLRNIFKEIQRDLGVPIPVGPQAGSLARWAEQGVLLLNTSLTVEDGLPASHSDWGWEVLTDKIIQALAGDASPRAFLLWGAHAQTRAACIEGLNVDGRHLVLKANHPSPLSALRQPVPFIGCGHFGQVNQWLKAHHQKPMAW